MSAIQTITKQKTQTAVTIKSVKIEKLFEIFDYDIEYTQGENVLIITGPNGFGKTQMLNILFSLFNRKFHFFYKLIFNKISVSISSSHSIKIEKAYNKKDKVTKLLFIFYKNGKEVETFDYIKSFDKDITRDIERYLPVKRIDYNEWLDRRTDRVFTTQEVLEEYSGHLPPRSRNKFKQFKTESINDVIDSINVHLIREQRLFKKVSADDNMHQLRMGAISNGPNGQTFMVETINTYSNELRGLISTEAQESYSISQELDSSYPTRLISEKTKISKEDYDKRFAKLKEKQNKLIKNGLYESKQATLEYSETDAKALLVYLNDLEKKLSVFDDLLKKLELFTGILNERRFTFKSIKINREKGFYFETSKGKELQLSELSSGEQHEVVLLYELIFNTTPNTLVLIDEPEISLHITWQKEFLKDLFKIIKIQNFQVMIATHAPAIINDRWDLVYNLEKTV